MRRIITICLLSLLSLSVCAKSNDWGGFSRYKQANSEISISPSVVLMGDSITDLWEKIDPSFFTDNNFACRGISGQVSSQMLVRFRPDVIELKPQVVAILAGTNDIAKNNGEIELENILDNIISMCELAKANGIQVILCSVLPSSQYRWRKEVNPIEPIKQLNSMLQEYARQQKILYLDYYSALVAEDFSLPQKWSQDNCHPNLACYQRVMEPMLLNAVAKLSKRKGLKIFKCNK